jgi:hypothetical protein
VVVAEALQSNKHLRTLLLEFNSLGEKGAVAIGKALVSAVEDDGGGGGGRMARGGRSERGRRPPTQDTAVSKRGVVVTRKTKEPAPGTVFAIKVLGLASNDIGDAGGAALVEGATVAGLLQLFLGLNRITDDEGRIAGILKKLAPPKNSDPDAPDPLPGCTLEELDLNHNQIHNTRTCSHLAKAAKAAGVGMLRGGGCLLEGNRGFVTLHHLAPAFPNPQVRRFKPRKWPPPTGDGKGDLEEDVGIEEEEVEGAAEEKTYFATLKRSIANAQKLKVRREEELRAAPFDGERVRAFKLADREVQRATFMADKARDNKRRGVPGPWDHDPEESDEEGSDWSEDE